MPLNQAEKEELFNTEIAYLATANLQGSPHIKPIWFIYHQGKIWFETDISTKAFKNIQQNNKVALCFGGKETLLVWGSVKWSEEKDCPIPFRKLLWDKYGDDMDDSYITEQTRIFELITKKETSWHYADQDWE